MFPHLLACESFICFIDLFYDFTIPMFHIFLICITLHGHRLYLTRVFSYCLLSPTVVCLSLPSVFLYIFLCSSSTCYTHLPLRSIVSSIVMIIHHDTLHICLELLEFLYLLGGFPCVPYVFKINRVEQTVCLFRLKISWTVGYKQDIAPNGRTNSAKQHGSRFKH